ncbi:MAG TPA: hypothetical protein VIK89_16930 [Cytophagaceae bacterium]
MKNLLSLLMISSMLFVTLSCGKKDDDQPQPGVEKTYVITNDRKGSTDVKRIIGTINENFTIKKEDKYLLSGGVFVAEGATLTIEAGATIYGDADGSGPAFLSVLRGAKIYAVGTATEPIVFTSSNVLVPGISPESGDWAGLVLNGRASINVGSSAEGEGGTGTYGGTDDDDNSGELKYVRLEYAGRIVGTDNELNGFSFNGVGRGTRLSYLQSYMGEDDGFEFFGGTANLSYAVSTGSKDDSFDWTHGWRGNGQFWVVVQAPGRGDRGIEADNLEQNFMAAPISNPTLSNLTFIGSDGNSGATIGMKLRHGTQAKIYNALITGFKSAGIDLDDSSSTAYQGTSLIVDNTIVDTTALGSSSNAFKDASVLKNYVSNVAGTIGTLTNTYVGTVASGAKNPTELGAYFEAANYIGAVPSDNDWTKGWVKNLDGSIHQ